VTFVHFAARGAWKQSVDVNISGMAKRLSFLDITVKNP
jgi:hypothetical protein